jgi:hypothetical protein
VPQAVFLDFDRTMSSPAANMRHLHESLAAIGAASFSDDLHAEQQRVEAAHKSFDAYGYIAPRLDEAGKLADLQEQYATEGGNVLYDDVGEFVAQLDAGMVPYTVLTYGGREWQRLKLLGSGFLGAAVITPEQNKGKVVEAFRMNDAYGFVSIVRKPSPLYFTQEIVLIDDKRTSFTNWPGPGYCIERPGETVQTDVPMPPNVQRITGLDELRVHEGRVLHRDDVPAGQQQEDAETSYRVQYHEMACAPLVNRLSGAAALKNSIILEVL